MVLFLCKECVDHIHMLTLSEELFDAITYQIKIQDYGFTDTGSITSLLMKTNNGFTRIVLAGVGTGKACTPNHLRIAAGNVARELQKHKIKQAIAAAPLLINPKRGHYLKALTEGLLLGSYRFDKYKSKKDNGRNSVAERNKFINSEVHNICSNGKDNMVVTVFSAIDNVEKIISAATSICKAIFYARDLANEPGNIMNPETLATEAVELAEKYKMEVEVLSSGDLKKLGMGAIWAVGQGSVHETKMVTLRYSNDQDKSFIAFVGKGITFDSGGISIKPSEGMGDMKEDMTGAAVVLGAMQAIADLQMPVNVIGIVACAENMPSGSAQRPGDIIRAGSGKTIEIDNTDAEGRLILADAVWYACRKGAMKVINIATLTGAVSVALGDHTSGIIANDNALAREIIKAGHRVGEAWWLLPILEEAEEMLENNCADIKNNAGRPAGTITGGVFIGQFVNQGLPWAHLDIGGTSTAKKTAGHLIEGCTAFGTATLVELARTF